MWSHFDIAVSVLTHLLYLVLDPISHVVQTSHLQAAIMLSSDDHTGVAIKLYGFADPQFLGPIPI
jgi:hypothetical protein